MTCYLNKHFTLYQSFANALLLCMTLLAIPAFLGSLGTGARQQQEAALASYLLQHPCCPPILILIVVVVVIFFMSILLVRH
jgi:hypothetical protein